MLQLAQLGTKMSQRSSNGKTDTHLRLRKKCKKGYTKIKQHLRGNVTVASEICVYQQDVYQYGVFHYSPSFLLAGMLLELPGPVLSQMLQDEALLTSAVEKALGALQVAQEHGYRKDFST